MMPIRIRIRIRLPILMPIPLLHADYIYPKVLRMLEKKKLFLLLFTSVLLVYCFYPSRHRHVELYIWFKWIRMRQNDAGSTGFGSTKSVKNPYLEVISRDFLVDFRPVSDEITSLNARKLDLTVN